MRPAEVRHTKQRGSHRLCRSMCFAVGPVLALTWAPKVDAASTQQVAKRSSPAAAAAPAKAVTRASVLSASLPVGLSFGDRLRSLSSADLKATLLDARALGVTWIRIDFDWSAIQPVSRSRFDWTALDRVVSEARAQNLAVL